MTRLTPVPVSNGRSKDYRLIVVNEYDKEEPVIGYWHDIDKCWKSKSTGNAVKNVIRWEEID